MLKLGDALAGWNPAQKGAAPEPLAMLEAGWHDIVGEEVARHSAPSRIANATLTITTQSSAWSHQLSFLSDQVLRAVDARLPAAGIRALRFRVGRLPQRAARLPRPRRAATLGEPPSQAQAADAAEALARFRRDVETRRRARLVQGWIECTGCAALLAPDGDALCSACVAARTQELRSATARLLFEAPWLGCAGTIALIDGLQGKEYERIRNEVLAHWWRVLAQARARKRLSRDGRERLIASSYVLLQSKLPPGEILPATVRSILGDELHDLLYREV